MPTDWTQEQITALIEGIQRIAAREVAVPLPGGQGILGLFGGDITHGSADARGGIGQLTRQELAASGLGNATLIEVTDTDPAVVVTVAAHRATYPGALLVVKDASGAAGVNPITIVDEAGRLFDGQPHAYISFNSGYYWAYSDGNNWLTIHTDTILSADLGPDSVGEEELQETGVVAGVYGSATEIPVITIDADGRATAASTTPASLWSTGDIKWRIATGADPGWVLMRGRSIGNAASGASERADADTEALFVHCWNAMANAQAPVSGGRGASGAADFAAGKTLTLPDAQGRTLAHLQLDQPRITTAVSGFDGGTLGASGGSQSHILTTTEMPSHVHGGPTGAFVLGNGSTVASGTGSAIWGANSSTSSSGGDAAHRNVQPTLIMCCMVKL